MEFSINVGDMPALPSEAPRPNAERPIGIARYYAVLYSYNDNHWGASVCEEIPSGNLVKNALGVAAKYKGNYPLVRVYSTSENLNLDVGVSAQSQKGTEKFRGLLNTKAWSTGDLSFDNHVSPRGEGIYPCEQVLIGKYDYKAGILRFTARDNEKIKLQVPISKMLKRDAMYADRFFPAKVIDGEDIYRVTKGDEGSEKPKVEIYDRESGKYKKIDHTTALEIEPDTTRQKGG